MSKAVCWGWIFSLVFAMARPGLSEFQISVGSDDCGASPGPSGCLGGNYTDTGSTAGANNTIGQVNAGCFERTSLPGADVIYTYPSFLVSSSPVFDIHVTPAAGYDVAIYLVGPSPADCPVGTNATVSTCRAGSDAGGPGVTETISRATLAAIPPGTYALFIDSAASGAAASGSYTVSIGPGICPVELMDFTVE